MGTILTGYGDASYDHEGYAAQVLDDGSLTSTYSDRTDARMIGQVVAACDCGWTGTTRYPTTGPFDERARDLALEEWETAHARPVLEAHQQERSALLMRLLVDLAQAHRNPIGTGRAGERLELLESTLRVLAEATELAGELREQAARAVEQTGESR